MSIYTIYEVKQMRKGINDGCELNGFFYLKMQEDEPQKKLMFSYWKLAKRFSNIKENRWNISKEEYEKIKKQSKN